MFDYSRSGSCFYIHLFKEDLFNSSQRDLPCTFEFPHHYTQSVPHIITDGEAGLGFFFFFPFCLPARMQALPPVFEALYLSRRWPQPSSPSRCPQLLPTLYPHGQGIPNFTHLQTPCRVFTITRYLAPHLLNIFL